VAAAILAELTNTQPAIKVAKTSTRTSMHVFKKKAFVDACAQYPVKAESIMAAYKVLDKSMASRPEELKTALSTLDNFTHRNGWWVIDIGGNELRLIAAIDFKKQYVNVKHIFNHAEYDKANKWYRSPKNKGVMP
jgi:mRNA interferase HigB